MKTPIFLMTGAFGLMFCQPVLASQTFDPGMPAPKVSAKYYKGAEKSVYHVTVKGDEKAYLAILGNVRNHLAAMGDAGVKPKIKVVINGDGIGMLTLAKDLEFDAEAKLPGSIKELKEAGVDFNVCYRTLTGRKIKADTLFDVRQSELVPSGVAEIARLQHQRYQLIKP